MNEGTGPESGLTDSLGCGSVPYVHFARDLETEITTDCVAFDDYGGGEQATRHLMQLGHRKIAFLGLHEAGTHRGFRYSVERERGWKSALESAGIATDSLSFCPAEAMDCSPEDQLLLGQRLGRVLARDPAITAVVSVNSLATRGFCRALEETGVPGDRWPAIVSFDEDPLASGHVISTMKVPWRELGQQAASLLWERGHGQLPGPPEQRCVSMRLIPRLTSHASWAGALDLAQIQRLAPSSVGQRPLPAGVKAA
jgi:LacI family transcriptional regulator